VRNPLFTLSVCPPPWDRMALAPSRIDPASVHVSLVDRASPLKVYGSSNDSNLISPFLRTTMLPNFYPN